MPPRNSQWEDIAGKLARTSFIAVRQLQPMAI
jgi:hypothetical protein